MGIRRYSLRKSNADFSVAPVVVADRLFVIVAEHGCKGAEPKPVRCVARQGMR